MRNNALNLIDARDANAAFNALDAGLTLDDAIEAAELAAAEREDKEARESMANRAARHGMLRSLMRWFYSK